MDAFYRGIEVALVTEELHDALDVIVAGLEARQREMEELLRAADPAEIGAEEWDQPEHVAWRKEMLGQLVFRSVFLICWASFEQQLSGYCADLRGERGLALAEKEVHGAGIERSMTYLRKVVGVEIDLNAWGWPQIKAYNGVRNHFAHVGPDADHQNARGAEEAWTGLPGLRFDAGQIVVGEEFVRHAIRSMQHFLIGIDRSLIAETSKEESDERA